VAIGCFPQFKTKGFALHCVTFRATTFLADWCQFGLRKDSEDCPRSLHAFSRIGFFPQVSCMHRQNAGISACPPTSNRALRSRAEIRKSLQLGARRPWSFDAFLIIKPAAHRSNQSSGVSRSRSLHAPARPVISHVQCAADCAIESSSPPIVRLGQAEHSRRRRTDRQHSAASRGEKLDLGLAVLAQHSWCEASPRKSSLVAAHPRFGRAEGAIRSRTRSSFLETGKGYRDFDVCNSL
jgi:hypothetical protein